ncbi:MAG: TldD/PmbA family protein [Myxococcaceae bacterium]|nr:TldD/PmbA family protein [Myxococcaceae bacterium]
MLVTLVCAAVLGAKPPPDARQDLLDAMVIELDRNFKTLKLKENAPPYFLAYSMKDFEQREISARYGAIYQDDTYRDRKLYVDARVGDYTFDSSIDDEIDFTFSLKGNSFIPRKNAPLDEHPLALRTSLWLVSDQQYKAALFNFLKKKGEDVYAVDDPKRPASFTREEPVVYLGNRLPFSWSHDRWAALARDVSGTFGAAPQLLDSEVRIAGDKVVRYLVNTEGTRIVTEEALYAVHLSVWARADDGQLLDDSRDWYAPTEEQLPTDAQVREAAKKLVEEISALRAAPSIDPYTGPAILESDAAGVLFHEAVGHRLEGERQGSDAEGKTFRGQVGKNVIAGFVSIYDDPTVREAAGKQLNGWYLYDDEGVKAQRVPLVEGGVLKNFLLSRKPIEGFSKSNGHGRAQSNHKPVARMANLIVESKKQVDDKQLKAMLIAEAKRQGKPYGLIIKDITGGNTNTSSFGYQAFKGVPRMVYRVDVRDGRETLVRGVEIVGTPLSSINKIMASGKTSGTFNGFCGAESGMVPVSTVSPPMLLQEIELQRVVEGKDRPPLLPPPGSAK